MNKAQEEEKREAIVESRHEIDIDCDRRIPSLYRAYWPDEAIRQVTSYSEVVRRNYDVQNLSISSFCCHRILLSWQLNGVFVLPCEMGHKARKTIG